MFSDLREVKKGNKGEKIIQDYLEITNHIVYKITTINKPHWFDGMATKNKEKVFFYEVKTKPKMLSYEAQGFDKNDYEVYLNLYNKTKTPLIVFFVDCKNGNVHCVDFKKLIKLTETKEIEYQDKNIIAWNLKHLDLLFKLTNEQINSF